MGQRARGVVFGVRHSQSCEPGLPSDPCELSSFHCSFAARNRKLDDEGPRAGTELGPGQGVDQGNGEGLEEKEGAREGGREGWKESEGGGGE